PALNNAEPQELNSSSCLADYFKWPQVALTHHLKLSNRIEPHLASPVNPRKIEVVSIRFLCATSGSSVSVVSLLASTHHRDTENTEVAQRRSSNYENYLKSTDKRGIAWRTHSSRHGRFTIALIFTCWTRSMRRRCKLTLLRKAEAWANSLLISITYG